MSYLLTYEFQVTWAADGVGQNNQEIGPAFGFEESGLGQYIAGGATITSAGVTAACVAAGVDMAAQITAQPKFAQIQSVASGGPYF